MWRVAIVLCLVHCYVRGQGDPGEWDAQTDNFPSVSFGDDDEGFYNSETEGGSYNYDNNDNDIFPNSNYFYGNYNPDYSSGGGSGEPDAAEGTFAITFKLKYKRTLSDETSKKYIKISNDIVRDVSKYIAEEMASITDDFDVVVKSFEPGAQSRHTQAVVDVTFQDYTRKTKEELVRVMERFSETGKIGGKKVIEVTEVAVTEVPDAVTTPEGTPEPPTPVDHNVLIVYKKRFNNKLADPTTNVFQREKSVVEEEINLYLIIKETLDPHGLIGVNVQGFQPKARGKRTEVNLTVSVTNVPSERLEAALANFIGEPLHGKVITAAELVAPSTTSPAVGSSPPSPQTKCFKMYAEVQLTHQRNPDLQDGPIYPDCDNAGLFVPKQCNGFTSVCWCVEPQSGSIIPNTTTGFGEGARLSCDDNTTTPTTTTVTTRPRPPTNRGDGNPNIPDTNEPNPPDSNEPNPPDTNEPNPPDTNEPNPPDTNEPNPPDTNEPNPPDTNEPDPPEVPDHCLSLTAPELGEIQCSNDNQLDSTCQFTCNEGTSLAGVDTLTCASDGSWNADPPYCIRIFCAPHTDNQELPNGQITCSNHNLYGSVCTFRCNRGYQLNGTTTSRCENAKLWSEPNPECQLIPIDCEIAYSEWSVCEDGTRSKEGYIVQEAVGTGTPCPSPVPYREEACVDCVVEWEEWGECANGERVRNEFIKQEQVGAGEPCPELSIEVEKCVNCEVEWKEWEECSGGERRREQYVSVEPVGAGAGCGELQSEKEDCVHCEMSWGQWTDCTGGSRSRFQQITIQAVGAGNPCLPLRSEVQDCTDCQLEWGEWGACANGLRSRSQVVSVEQVGAGIECDPPITEDEDCVDCQMEWKPWGECGRGIRSRVQYISVEQVGAGKPCPVPKRKIETCIDCQVEWGDWEDCSNGMRSRFQFISRPAEGAGQNCSQLLEDVEVCVDCEVAWGNWSACQDNERIRRQYISVQPIGEGAQQCPHMEREIQDCFDCEVAWGDWSECRGGKRSRAQFVIIEATGGGKPCTLAEPEVEDCVDCQVDWAEWGRCKDGERSRQKYVTVEPVGAGLPCPLLDVETTDCSNCIVEWEPWSNCSEGIRSRSQFISNPASGGGVTCPVVVHEEEICIDCELAWADWSDCLDGQRIRYQYERVRKEGAGKRCPDLGVQDEVCVHCELAWGNWSSCFNNLRTRTQYIAVQAVGAGNQCFGLDSESERCRDCVVEWENFGACVNGQMRRRQFVSSRPLGGGEECPELNEETEACSDCVVDWGEWGDCILNQRSRTQVVLVESTGTGSACPRLQTESERCGSTPIKPDNEVLCRYTRDFLGYGTTGGKRDILLLGDESGSIGWINFDKIKEHFKAITRNVRGGIGSRNNQVAMMSFAGWTRTQFGFDTYQDTNDIIKAIDRAIFHGGHRSKIGQALIEANTWMFQQAEGMRSFPGYDDDNFHEILIATDGCRTSKGYFLHQGLKAIKKRGIKLSVLGIESHDPRCKGALKEMVDDPNDLYEVGNWNSLDDFNRRMDEHECRS